ncbi:hypothetical protein Ancab_030081 [Ancistrocladus abbreviatus]
MEKMTTSAFSTEDLETKPAFRDLQTSINETEDDHDHDHDHDHEHDHREQSDEEEEEEDDHHLQCVYDPLSHQHQRRHRWPKLKKNQVCLEGYVETADDDVLPRSKSLTDDDLEELKGCLDLGFGFSYDEIPELCNTLPALELCYSMSQKFLDDQHNHKATTSSSSSWSDTASCAGSEISSPIPNWKISSPGDDPEDVKARLKYWAQAVACTVKLCN